MKKTVVIAMLLAVPVGGCRRGAETAKEKTEPAHVAHEVHEQDLNTITLTEQAEQRLGIVTVPVERVNVPHARAVGGEVSLPPGQSIVVSAPLAGTVLLPEGTMIPAPGSKISAGQQVLRFTPLLSPERDVLTPADRVRVAQTKVDIAVAQIEAERQVESAKINVQAAQIAYDRAVQLKGTGAGSQRAVDEAGANLDLAKQALVTAKARSDFLADIMLDEAPGMLTTRPIESPLSGVLLSIDVAADETVAPGDPLFSVANLDRVWIRTSVYAGLRNDVDTEQPAAVNEYGRPPQADPLTARYVSAPPSANPAATSIDLYYELDNAAGRFFPGQRLAVIVPLKSSGASLVVPWASVLYDIHGGAWVYEQIEPRKYARRRVTVRRISEGRAVLADGPAAGAKIVTDGAAELFGTEFGVAH